MNRTKRKLDFLLFCHSIVALLSGAIAFVWPALFEFFFVHQSGDKLILHDNSPTNKVEHLIVRIYGALILGQFWIVWKARAIEDAHTRRALVQAYAIVFALTAVALLRAQLTEGGHFNAWNWLNISMFVGLSAFYAWFCIAEPIAVFEGLDKAVA